MMVSYLISVKIESMGHFFLQKTVTTDKGHLTEGKGLLLPYLPSQAKWMNSRPNAVTCYHALGFTLELSWHTLTELVDFVAILHTRSCIKMLTQKYTVPVRKPSVDHRYPQPTRLVSPLRILIAVKKNPKTPSVSQIKYLTLSSMYSEDTNSKKEEQKKKPKTQTTNHDSPHTKNWAIG